MSVLELNRRTFCGMTASVATGLAAPVLAQQQRSPVRVGVLGDFSTSYASVGGPALVEAVKMAAEEAGKVQGAPVEVVSADTQLKPDLASSIARQWFDIDGVDVIVDLPSSAMTFAVMDLASLRKKIILATSATSSDLTGKACSPYLAHWTYDTYSIAHSTASALAGTGAKSWFFVSQDSVAGTAAEKDVTDVVVPLGGKIVGSVRVANNTNDFSSYVLQAQGSRADVIIFSVAGTDAVRFVKQASEFGLISGGQRLAGVYTQPDVIKAIGLDTAQGIIFSTAFDWNLDEDTRAFSRRFLARAGKMPNMNMAGSYSAVRHYLAAISSAGTKDADAVMERMRAAPINDVFARDGVLRIDGRMSHGMYLMQAKSPAESTGEWDLAKVLARVPAEQAVRPLAQGGCPLVKT